MKNNRFNVIVDGQFGSCGKGLMSAYLTHTYNIRHVSTTNMANAGHTVVDDTKGTHVSKALPTSCILPRWYPEAFRRNPLFAYVGATAGFTMEQWREEHLKVEGPGLDIVIHPRAGIITPDHKYTEGGDDGSSGSTAHLASTMQGCGEMLADKIRRVVDFKMAGNEPKLAKYMLPTGAYEPDNGSVFSRVFYDNTVRYGSLHEGAQGFSLGINHGLSYPYCTSRECTAMQMAADMGIPAYLVGDVYMVIRPHAIRVGNVPSGTSGGWYPDQREITWDQIGVPAEITTVTKRPRRVATFSLQQVVESVRVNGVTKIMLNFANYIDPRVSSHRSWSSYTINASPGGQRGIRLLIDSIEAATGVPVTHVGTGPKISDVWSRD